jgi:phosphate transport system ATP-binding protein
MTRPDVARTAEPPPATLGVVALAHWSVWFGARCALDQVSLTMQPGRVTALIGPSGCGKSTLLRSVNRLNDGVAGLRHSGTIHIDGEEIHAPQADPSLLRQKVGMVFQRSNPFPTSIFDNVTYGPRLGGLTGRRELAALAERSLRRAALWEEVKDRLGESALRLSGGQQQRLCIARALANDPDVLLLDEPASALDPAATARIEELLYDLRRDVTIVIVTHNLQQAARVSDRTAFLLAGQLIEVDDTARLFTSPRESRTEAYITGRFG